jgi:cytochrome c biogenesis protein CcmG, thiol:disulfide interchange protein DsbE
MHIFIALFLLVLASPVYAKGVEEGKIAPNIEAKLLNGQHFSLLNESGKVVILNFWASWCTPCREEMPALEAYYKKYKGKGLEIIAISLDSAEDTHAAKEVMRSFTFPAAMRDESDVRGYGRIWRMPMTFVIDRYGILRKDGSEGDPKIDLSILEKIVTPLLNP